MVSPSSTAPPIVGTCPSISNRDARGRDTVTSCALGHSVSPGMESCEVCGDDLRHICSQGHASRASALFCETCGEMLPLAGGVPAMAAAAPLTMDYSSGSFADFIAGGDEDVPGPGLPSTVTAAEPIPEAERAPEPK